MNLKGRLDKLESSDPVQAAREFSRKRQGLIDSLMALIEARGERCRHQDAEKAIDSYLDELGKLLHLPLSTSERHTRAVTNLLNYERQKNQLRQSN